MLLLQEASGLDRYCRTIQRPPERNAILHHFPEIDALLLALTAESMLVHEIESIDTALHYALVYDQVLNFDLGFRSFSHPGPHWWVHGLSRWFARDVDPRLLLFATPADAALRPEEDSAWPIKIRARVEGGDFPSADEMRAWESVETWSFVDHMHAWSRVDFLIQHDDGAARRFFAALHQPVRSGPDRELLIAAQLENALESAVGLSPSAFDEAWSKFVRKHYKKRE